MKTNKNITKKENKYMAELKKVVWPTSDEVTNNFIVVALGIIALTVFFIITDACISFVLNNLYN